MKFRELAQTPPASGRMWLLGSLFLVTLPHFLRIPPWLTLLCIGIFLWRLLHETRGLDLPGNWLRVVLVLLGFGSVLAVYHSFIGREPGVALLTVMLCLKLIETHTMRDAMITLFIGYFMVISGFLFSQSILMGGYLFLVVLVLTAALAALNHPGGGARNNRFYLSFSGKLLLQSLPLMILMFLLFPRLSNPLWHTPDPRDQASTGLSDSMEPGSITNLADSSEVAFRVDFSNPVPPASQLYWRGPVLLNTDGRRWSQQELPVATSIPDFEPLDSTVAYTVTLEPHSRHWLFALDLPITMPTGQSTRAGITPDFQLQTDKPVKTKIRYSIQSSTNYRFTALPPEMEQLATSIPLLSNPRTTALAKKWHDQGLANEALVQHALNYFRNQPFYYTRKPPLMDKKPVDQFLFDSRRGFCEHYAAAFVTLMRSAGLPARVVTGYQGGEINPVGDYLIVRQSDAHAWAEVWLQGKGWTRVDPTSVIPPDRIESIADIERFTTLYPILSSGSKSLLYGTYLQLQQGWDAINHSWNQWVLGFDRKTQQKLLQKLGLDNLSWQWLVILMVMTVGAILIFLSVILLLRRRPRQTDPIVRLYQQFCDKLAKKGLVRAGNEGPADFARRLNHERPDLAGDTDSISKLYIRLRYGSHASASDLNTFKQRIRLFQP